MLVSQKNILRNRINECWQKKQLEGLVICETEGTPVSGDLFLEPFSWWDVLRCRYPNLLLASSAICVL